MNIKLDNESQERLKNGEKLFLCREGRANFTLVAKNRQTADSDVEVWNAVVIKGYNHKFQRALLKVYKEDVVDNPDYFKDFTKITLSLKRKFQKRKQFIAVITITDDEAFENATNGRCNPTVNGSRLIVDALNRELDWNELNGVKVEVLRSISEKELKELKE